MDRYAEQETAFEDDVPKKAMSKFVKSAPTESQGFGKVEIQVSRREQKLQSASHSSQQEAAARPPGSTAVPSWAATPPSEAVLLVHKDSRQIDSIPLAKAMTILGRSSERKEHLTPSSARGEQIRGSETFQASCLFRGQAADVILDHQSLSRQHASICYHKMNTKWLLMDLHSVHGSVCDGKPVPKGKAVELREGSKLQFGASTRVFVFQSSLKGAAGRQAPASSSGKGKDAGDGSHSGPRQSNSPGKFAGLVQEVYVADAPTNSVSKKNADVSRRRVSQPLRHGLYDSLPPPQKSLQQQQ